ncbi:MAG TPA: single-stranded DNA-binding protein [Planctomycetaceae bacterium]|nr:single-stranded DNA-binding protein [Planctomycetaceae bacterium]|tara:strand:+ start:204 stop:665 length:462 start_codon:yes stop_codon:yes gene_type:complete
MASYNKVILVGNLTRDPELRHIPSGTAVTDLGLAVNRTWTDRNTNQRNEETTFVDVTCWGRTAEIACEYLRKGRPVLVEGRLQMDEWNDRETGAKRTKLKVVCDNMQMLGSRNEGNSGGGGGGGSYQPPPQSDGPQQPASNPVVNPPDDEVPF